MNEPFLCALAIALVNPHFPSVLASHATYETNEIPNKKSMKKKFQHEKSSSTVCLQFQVGSVSFHFDCGTIESLVKIGSRTEACIVSMEIENEATSHSHKIFIDFLLMTLKLLNSCFDGDTMMSRYGENSIRIEREFSNEFIRCRMQDN